MLVISLLLLSHTQGARTAHTSGRIKCSQTMISTSISQNKGKKSHVVLVSFDSLYHQWGSDQRALTCCLKIKHDPANHFAYAFTIQVATANSATKFSYVFWPLLWSIDNIWSARLDRIWSFNLLVDKLWCLVQHNGRQFLIISY